MTARGIARLWSGSQVVGSGPAGTADPVAVGRLRHRRQGQSPVVPHDTSGQGCATRSERAAAFADWARSALKEHSPADRVPNRSGFNRQRAVEGPTRCVMRH